MMDLLSREDIKGLFEKRGDPCVSLFLPTHRYGKDIEQAPIRLKNLLRKVEDELKGRGLRSPQIEKIVEAPKQLLPDDFFWSHQSDGLAVFFNSEEFSYYRLPIRFEETAIISHRYHIKPLLPLFSGDGRFYILALSQNAVRLLQGSRYSVNQVVLGDIPNSLAEALKYDEPERQLQFHTGAQPGTQGGRGKRAAMFHGHGIDPLDLSTHKKNLLRFFQLVDRGLRDVFKNGHIPLVLAGVDYLLPLYQEANSYPYVLKDGIMGNPEELSDAQLHERGWGIVGPYFKKEQEEAAAKFEELKGTGKASNLLEEVVPAAYHGRIEYLFVEAEQHKWGNFDENSNEVKIHEQPEPGDEDLLDFAATHTFLSNGTVYAEKAEAIPGKSVVAAIFRY